MYTNIEKIAAKIVFKETKIDLSSQKFGNLSGTELAQTITTAFTTTGNSVTVLDLGSNNLGNLPGADLAKALPAISTSVKELFLSSNNLNQKTDAELVEIFAAIPLSVSYLDLMNNGLSDKQLDTIINALPPNVEFISIGIGEFIDIKAYLVEKPPITKIDLSSQKFGNLSGTELAQTITTAFTTTGNSVTVLDLGSNNLGNLPGADLAKALPAISTSVKELFLSSNHLNQKTDAELVEIFAAIPHSVSYLDLMNNGLSDKQLDTIINALPPNVEFISIGIGEFIDIKAYLVEKPPITKIDLSSQKFGNLSGTELAQTITTAFTTTGNSVTVLDLGSNNLDNLPGAELAKALPAISTSVKELFLSSNNLNQKTDAELVEIFAAIPLSVSYLDLMNNGLSDKQLDTIINALPSNVEFICKKVGEFIEINAHLVEKLVVEIAHLISKQGVTRFDFDTIKLPFEIDEKRLNQFIGLLEKQNNPIADLICGLLLEGYIETTSDILENCNFYDRYREKRNHDAITFYTKAAKDSTIKPIVEFILWTMKTTNLTSSIQNRLALYDVTPNNADITNTFSESFNNASHKRKGVTALLPRIGLFNSSSNTQELAVESSPYIP